MDNDIQTSEYKSQLLDLLSEHLPDMLWVKDRDGKYVFANKAICDNLLMAKDTTEPIGKGDIFFALRERATKPDNPHWHTFGELCFNSDEVVIENNHSMRFEEYGNIKGKLTYLEVFKAPFYDKEGKTIGTVGAGRDITEYKKLQIELENSLDTLENIQEIANVGTWELDVETGNFIWSKEMYNIYGVSSDTFIPTVKTRNEFLSDDDISKISNAMIKACRDFEVIELRYTLHKRDGTLTHLLVRAKAVTDDNSKVSIIGTSLDISSQYYLETIIKQQKDEFQFKATHDPLTNLPNRTMFIENLDTAIIKAQKNESNVVVLFIDLDNFKPINDSLGHEAGDMVLIELSQRMLKRSRSTDTIARLGGDEFCVILDDVHDLDAIVRRLEEGMNIVKEPFVINYQSLYIGLSIGVAVYPKDGTSAMELLKNADTAMYQAKQEGKGRFSFYDTAFTSSALATVTMKSELREAISNEAFEVYFQPQIDTLTCTMTGMEALVRWPHPTLGLIQPNDFLPLAQSSGLIIEIDKIVMKKAITQLSLWYKEGLEPGVLSLNLTVQMLQVDGFVSYVESLISSTKCSTKHIEFEVTENEIMRNPAEAIKVLKALSELNIKLSVDDFGTGYSSLAYLKRLPINKLKIDKSFVDDLPHDSDDVAIVKAVISLAQSLGLEIIAEGVENALQKEFLMANGCSNFQGYLFSKPLSSDDMHNYLITAKELHEKVC